MTRYSLSENNKYTMTEWGILQEYAKMLFSLAFCTFWTSLLRRRMAGGFAAFEIARAASCMWFWYHFTALRIALSLRSFILSPCSLCTWVATWNSLKNTQNLFSPSVVKLRIRWYIGNDLFLTSSKTVCRTMTSWNADSTSKRSIELRKAFVSGMR